MRKIALLILAAAMLASSAVIADPAAFAGIAYTFDGKAGITLKLLSDNEEEKWVAAIGGTYYFNSKNELGIDVSGGYTFDDAAVLIGWEILQVQPQISAGWADTEE